MASGRFGAGRDKVQIKASVYNNFCMKRAEIPAAVNIFSHLVGVGFSVTGDLVGGIVGWTVGLPSIGDVGGGVAGACVC